MSDYNTINLLGAQRGGLESLIDKYVGGNEAVYTGQMHALNQLAAAYDPEGYEKAVRDNAIQQANEAQQQMLTQAATKAGSAFNTAAQSAAQKSTASAVADINAQAENQIANYKQASLSNLLNQYGNYTSSYQNLLEQLLGGTSVEKKEKTNWGQIAGTVVGGIGGAIIGGPAGAAVGASIGGAAGSAFD